MTEKRSTEVPGQLFGYTLQVTRMLIRLLDAETGAFVSVEVFDDVALQHSDGMMVAEQSKTAIDRNPVSDNSSDLWKTFKNWLAAAKSGKLDVSKTMFELYVSAAKDGEVVKAFHKAKTKEEAEAAYAAAKTKVLTKGGKPTEAKRHATEFFQESDKQLACAIIEKFSLVKGTGYIAEDIRKKFRSSFLPEDLEDLCVQNALGWIKMQSETLLEQHLPCIIAYDDFKTEMTAYISKIRHKPTLESLADDPTDNDIDLLKSACFVDQLRLVDLDSEILESISDYFLASADRVRWIAKGWVHRSSMSDLDKTLKRYWKNELGFLTSGDQVDETLIGKKLFYRCNQHRTQVESMEPPAHFIPGCFQALSNSLSIGWHPKYKDHLKGRGQK